MDCNIKYQTNITGQVYIEDDVNGVDNLRLFMEYATQKKPIEFMEDRDGLDATPCILESTNKDPKGTSFSLKELYSEKLANYFETGKLVFRRIN